jgi:hypothetical protein
MLAAIAALEGEPALPMRAPGDWYVDQRNVDVKTRGAPVAASAYGNGTTPEEVVRDHWRALTDLKPNEVVVLRAYVVCRQYVRWNGFVWADVPAEAPRP